MQQYEEFGSSDRHNEMRDDVYSVQFYHRGNVPREVSVLGVYAGVIC